MDRTRGPFMRFTDRSHAAQLLATRLEHYRGHHPVVLGVPRGAVPMARIIADALEGDLDVVLVRKLRAPGQPEFAIGAVDEAGTVVQGEYFAMAPATYVREEIAEQQRVLRARRRQYGLAHRAVELTGRVVILVDDGIATGSSMEAAIRLTRAKGPKAIVVAVAVAPPSTVERLRPLVDEVVCLHATEAFGAVGNFFGDFSEVTDVEVVAALTRSRPSRLDM